MGFFNEALRVFGLDMDSLADDAMQPRQQELGRASHIERILKARSIEGRRIVREGRYTFIDGQRVRRQGPYTYVGGDRVRSENGMTFIGDKQVTGAGGALYLDGERVEE